MRAGTDFDVGPIVRSADLDFVLVPTAANADANFMPVFDDDPFVTRVGDGGVELPADRGFFRQHALMNSAGNGVEQVCIQGYDVLGGESARILVIDKRRGHVASDEARVIHESGKESNIRFHAPYVVGVQGRTHRVDGIAARRSPGYQFGDQGIVVDGYFRLDCVSMFVRITKQK